MTEMKPPMEFFRCVPASFVMACLLSTFLNPGLSRATSVADARLAMKTWPEGSVLMAERMIEKYGAPDEIQPERLVWTRKGEWVKIAVWRHEGLSEREGILERSVRFESPAANWWDVENLGLGVRYEPVGQVLTAVSNNEEANYLALNLAAEVMQGKRSVAEARTFYSRTVELMASGKSSPYMQGLMFLPAYPYPYSRRQPGQVLPLP